MYFSLNVFKNIKSRFKDLQRTASTIFLEEKQINLDIELEEQNENANKTNELIETAINVLNRPRTATPCVQIENPRTADTLFAKMVGKVMGDIPDGHAKDMLKLDIQKKIYETKYSTQTIQTAPDRLMRDPAQQFIAQSFSQRFSLPNLAKHTLSS